MTDYIIRSVICLLLFLAFYHFVLEREKMHRFNRFYLLFSMVFGLCVPLLNVTAISILPESVSPIASIISTPFPLLTDDAIGTSPKAAADASYRSLAYLIYCLVLMFLLVRFVRNLLTIASTISKSRKVPAACGTIVLLKEERPPHSFLQYTFLNEEQYLGNKIPEQIIKHELTHVRELHTVDILLVEVIKIIFWFNPVFLFYSKAIRINHEFLADEQVLAGGFDITQYQYLLLSAVDGHANKMASTFNYSVTKKRLAIMDKQSSKAGMMIKKLAFAVLIACSTVLFSRETGATEYVMNSSSNILQVQKDRYFNGGMVRLRGNAGNVIEKRYEELQPQQKQLLPAPESVSQTAIKQWTDTAKFIVLKNFTRLISRDLLTFQSGDFAGYHTMKSAKNSHVFILLFTQQEIQSFKSNGGIFDVTGEQFMYILPPPVVIPPSGTKN